jgi:tetratricopeptide (TPR) repeat protein
MNRKQRRAATRQAAAPDPSALFADALRHHQAGRLNEAERLYRHVLAAKPRHADSLHLLGVVAYQTRRYDLAVDLIGQSITITPNVAAYHSNLGNAFKDKGRLEEAIASYRAALELKPDYAEAHNNLGLALRDQGDLDEAAASYRAAIEHRPDYANAHNHLGIALQELGQPGEAIVHYRKAIAATPDFAEAYNNLGSALLKLGRSDEAIACYRQALALKPDYPDAYNNLGLALRRHGQFEAAFAAHEWALRLGFDRNASYYALSGCRKFTQADRPLLAEMTAAIDDARASAANRAMHRFALGKICDDLAEYEAAIHHFDAANRLEREKRQFDRLNFTASIDRSLTTKQLDTSGASASDLPIFIVGMPRSGTTLVEQILASHPKVAAGGEIDFWLQWLDRADDAVPPSATRDYLRVLAAIAPNAARVTDKVPYNFLHLGRLHRLFPNARIVHCRRNPIDTALSIYFTRFAPHTRFARMNDFAYDRGDIVFYYQEYRRLMAHWRVIIGPDRLIEIDYEHMVAEPEANVRRLLAFCGLDWDDACLAFHRTDRPIGTASAWQARQPIYRTSAERWRNYAPWLGELRALLPAEPVADTPSGKS